MDGVVASCYAYFSHDLDHITMTPMRWFPETMRLVFGDGDGFPMFIQLAMDVARVVTPVYQNS